MGGGLGGGVARRDDHAAGRPTEGGAGLRGGHAVGLPTEEGVGQVNANRQGDGADPREGSLAGLHHVVGLSKGGHVR